MNGNTPTPHLYITLAWTHKNEDDFSYLARQLKSVGLEAVYEPIELRPGKALWDRIAPRLACGEVAGWAYVLMPRSLTDRLCRDELLSSLDRAWEQKGAAFPLLGLLHGFSVQSLPLALKLRPCIHLADPAWKEQVKAIMGRRSMDDSSEYLWRVHTCYGGDSSRIAIEVTPRHEGVGCWRFAVPTSVAPVQWGHGTSGGGDISPVRFSVVRGAGKLENKNVSWFGSEDALSQTESAYVVFDGLLPEFICFGRARNRSGPPGRMEIFHTGLNRP